MPDEESNQRKSHQQRIKRGMWGPNWINFSIYKNKNKKGNEEESSPTSEGKY